MAQFCTVQLYHCSECGKELFSMGDIKERCPKRSKRFKGRVSHRVTLEALFDRDFAA